MQWLDTWVLLAAAVDFVVAGASCAYLLHWAGAATTRPRRLAAAALALVNAGLALEALAFVWLAAPASDGPASHTAAVVLVRIALLASSLLMGALLLRDAARR